MLTLLVHDSPWPPHNGGRARLVGLYETLSAVQPTRLLVATNRHHRVDVIPPAVALPSSRRTRLGALLGGGSRIGRGLLDAGATADLRAGLTRPAPLVVSHSFLVPELGHVDVPLVVDFPNLEVARQASAGTPLGRLESLKARKWEPRVARQATTCIAVDEEDAQQLRAWGASEVIVVPNAAPSLPVCGDSPADGYVLAVADWTYEPNRREVPRLRALDLPLVLAGRGSEAWPEGRGWVDDLAPLYDSAAVVIAPARSGGGTQLKVVEAVCRGRVVVTTEHGARSLPQSARAFCLVGPLEEGVRRLLADVDDRHQRERGLRQAHLPRSWRDAARPLTDAIERMARATA